MDRYEIYCTEEQTKKALNLGAPLEINEGKNTVLCRYQNYNTYKRCVIPTAAQMIGWLEEQKEINYITISNTGDDWYYDVRSTDLDFFDSYMVNLYCKTREEATLKAIDAALKYLTENKK